MSINRILVMVAVALFALVALSAFSDDINVNEPGWLALGLAAWAASSLVIGVGRPIGTRRRSGVLR